VIGPGVARQIVPFDIQQMHNSHVMLAWRFSAFSAVNHAFSASEWRPNEKARLDCQAFSCAEVNMIHDESESTANSATNPMVCRMDRRHATHWLGHRSFKPIIGTLRSTNAVGRDHHFSCAKKMPRVQKDDLSNWYPLPTLLLLRREA
jgi:hypothetical protein